MARYLVGIFLMGMVWASAVTSEPRDAVRAYFFANSLVNHVTNEERTNVPHWLNALARADGRALAVNGQWGFLKDFPASLPPQENWSFRGVPRAWNPDRGGFEIGRFDTIVTNPANFVQYQPPDAPYEWENPDNLSPVDAAASLFGYTGGVFPQARHFVYEGWAEMAGVAGYPPNRRGLRRYHALNRGDYHDWYVAFTDALDAALPDTDVGLIPVASVLATILDEAPLDDLDGRALYLDDAPHGTETLYFLAAMITYAVLYDAPPPAGFVPPDTIDPVVVGSYPALAARIWELTADARAAAPSPAAAAVEAEAPAIKPETAPEEEPVAQSGPEPDAAAEADATAAAAPQAAPPQHAATFAGLPALGIGLNGVSDWSTQHPFLDVMKTARPWIGHSDAGWGTIPVEALRSGGHLDQNGWPVSLPEDATAIETFILTDQPEEAQHLRGWYVMRYDGKADFKVQGRARRVQYDPGTVRFFFDPGDGPVGIAITAVDADDPIRNISVVAERFADLHAAGALFNPDWLTRIEDVRAIRFMDWMMTNGSPITTWEERPRVTDMSYAAWGVPLEVMIRLANRIGADPWFTLPHMADDDYVRRFAEQVKRDLDPSLKAYVEYSNEVWNFVFPQAVWAQSQAEALWGPSETGWIQFYALRAAQVADTFTEVFGDQAASRLVRVVATHTGWPGLEDSILSAPLPLMQTGKLPKDSFDAYAVTGYFGFEMGEDAMAGEIRGLIARSTEAAEDAGRAQGLQRVSLREYIRENRFAGAFAPMAEALRAGSFAELLTETWPYHARVARDAGLDLVMYEGGTHVTGHGEQVSDEDLAEFFIAFNYSPEMAALYRDLLQGWAAAGGTLFNAFVDVSRPTQWGSWGNLRHLDDSTGRWDALMAYNASGPNGWEMRQPSDFAGGLTLIGGDGSDDLQGGGGDDAIAGGGGDDVITTGGGFDVVHGGDGTDRVILPEARSEYAVSRDGPVIVLQADRHEARLLDVEQVRFGGEADDWQDVSGL